MPDEFGLIAELFAPLSRGYDGAHSLRDDAAFIKQQPGKLLTVTTDTIVEGVHFLGGTAPGLVARKLVRVNLSDLAAKGAQPFAVMVNAAFPKDIGWDWLRGFAAGLKQDFDCFGLWLIGGDTVSIPGPLCLGLTAFGWCDPAHSPHRSGAGEGDDIWVTGTIGDGGAGLLAAQNKLPGGTAAESAFLKDRYDLPQPRVDFGVAMAPYVSASMDVSDGLVQDLGHICTASGLGAQVDVGGIPMSSAFTNAGFTPVQAIAMGDDYELLFTASPANAAVLRDCARTCNVDITRIGRMMQGSGVLCLDPKGRDVTPVSAGWRHFKEKGQRQ